MAKIAKWIVIDYQQEPSRFRCERCGEDRAIHFPCAVDDFTKQGEAFSESHKFCKKEKP